MPEVQEPVLEPAKTVTGRSFPSQRWAPIAVHLESGKLSILIDLEAGPAVQIDTFIRVGIWGDDPAAAFVPP